MRPPLVVDCSMLAGRLFHEEWKQQAADIVAGRTLHAPQLLVTEITSVALKKHKRGMAEIALEGLQAFALLDIQLHAVAQPAQVLALALRYQLSACDASYLWLAAELKAPLATFDQLLVTAAGEHLGSLD